MTERRWTLPTREQTEAVLYATTGIPARHIEEADIELMYDALAVLLEAARLAGSLLDVIKRELVQRGYEEVEPGGSGVWTHPEWDGATDHIFPAIQDCFEREAE